MDITRNINRFAYILALILPFGLIFNRATAEVCVALIGVSFLLYSRLIKDWRWLADPVVKIGFIAWGWLVFISVFAVTPLESFGVAVPWIRYILLYAAFKNMVFVRAENLLLAGKVLAFMLLFVVIDTLWQYIYGMSLTGHLRADTGRLTGPLDNVKVGIFMAKMLFPVAGICLFFASVNKNKRGIIGSVFLLVGVAVTVLLTGERTAFASVTIALFFCIFLPAILERHLRKALLLGASAVLLIFAGLFTTQSWVRERGSAFYETISDYSAGEYWQLQKAGIIIGSDHRQTGAGLKGFRVFCQKLFADGVITTENLHPHNLYIEWFAETGVIGFLLFFCLVVCCFYGAIKKLFAGKGIERIAPLFLTATLIVNFFPFMPTQSIFSNWPAILLWYSISVATASMNMLDLNIAQKTNQPKP